MQAFHATSIMGSSIPEPMSLPFELIDDLLCMTLTAWSQCSQVKPQAIRTLLPVVTPSTRFLRLAVGRFSFDSVDTACIDGSLGKVQAIFKYAVHVGLQSVDLAAAAAHSLAYAACDGRLDILTWWFDAAVAAVGDHPPPMPNRVILFSKIMDLAFKFSQDGTMASLAWLESQGYLPTLEELDSSEDAPGYANLFYDVHNASCMQVLSFLLNTYGVTDDMELNDGLVSDAASEGETTLLEFLVGHFQEHGTSDDVFKFHAAVLPNASYSGQIHVLEWWNDYACAHPQLTEGLYQQMVADKKPWALAFQPPLLLATILQERFGCIADSLSKASRGAQVDILDWFRSHGMMTCVKGPMQAWFTRIIDHAVRFSNFGVLDWWLHTDLEGLDRHVSYSIFKDRAGDSIAFRNWWRKRGLKPELPAESAATTAAAVLALFSDSQGHVEFVATSLPE